MTHRELLAMRERRRELEAEQTAEREVRERPIRQAEQELQNTYRKLATVYRDRMLGKVPDPDFFISPEVDGLRLSDEHRDEFNRHQCVRFREQHPNLPWDRTVIDLLQRYWDANQADLISTDMIAVAVKRAMELGLVHKAPPKPVPAPAPIPARQQTAPSPRPDDTLVGRDPDTGRERTYTRREADRMSADEYRRRFKVLPTFRDLFETVERL